MHKILLFLFLPFFQASLSTAEEAKPVITFERMLSFQWGNEPDQIGFSEHSYLTPGGKAHQGPGSFSVNPVNKDICIVDVVNNALKVYDKDARFKYRIPVQRISDSTTSEITFDSEGHLRLHNSLDFYVSEYSTSGEIVRKIKYTYKKGYHISAGFLVQNNMEFSLGPYHYKISGSPNDKNSFAQNIGQSINPGETTGRTYRFIRNKISDDGKRAKSHVMVTNKNETTQQLFFKIFHSFSE